MYFIFVKMVIISLIFYSIFTKIVKDKTTSKREINANKQNTAVAEAAMRNQNVTPAVAGSFNNFSTNNLLQSPAKISQPKIDATDRRQIEAYNQYKSNTTKEALDDIKRIHQIEKKKKEQNDIDQYPSGINIDAQVIFFVIQV